MTGAEPPPRVVVGGVSGTGKSTLGAALADRLGVPFVDGDDLHSPEAKAKMHRGEPLTDADRAPWLARVAAVLAEAPRGVVVACSALKRAYRDRLRAGAPHVTVLMLEAPRAVLDARMRARVGHFMPASLLASQLADYERPAPDEPRTAVLDDDVANRTVLDRALDVLAAERRPAPAPPAI